MKSEGEIIGEIAKREGSNSWAELMHESSYYDVVRCTKEAMSEYAAQQKSEWVPIEERLPETEENVFAMLNGRMCVMAYVSIKIDGAYHKVWAYVYDGINGDPIHDDNYFPTHWQPLPSPPKK